MATSKVIFAPQATPGGALPEGYTTRGNPFNVPQTLLGSATGSNSIRAQFRMFARLIRGAVGGLQHRTLLKGGKVAASATATLATPVATNVLTINGVALTAAQYNATGTVTAGGSEANNDTVTINGTVLTAKTSASGDPNLGQFTVSGTANTTAANLNTAINAHPALKGIVASTVAAAVVTVRAVSPGTAGNAITLATSAHFTVSGATLSGGAALVNNGWDPGGGNTQAATNLAAAVNASTSALVANLVTASSAAAVVTVTALCPGACGNAISLAKTGSPITLAGVTGGLITGGVDVAITT